MRKLMETASKLFEQPEPLSKEHQRAIKDALVPVVSNYVGMKPKKVAWVKAGGYSEWYLKMLFPKNTNLGVGADSLSSHNLVRKLLSKPLKALYDEAGLSMDSRSFRFDKEFSIYFTQIWPEDINEGPLRRDDPAWDDYSDERTEPDQEMKDAPYYVEWNAQSWEWYGDDDPSTGRGRYKPKGDGGRVVAINVPDYETAQKIANKLDDDYKAGDFEDKNVYGKQGDSGYVLDYHGSNIRSMSKMDDYDKETIANAHPRWAPKDFSA